jgi:hypothetical protein
MIGMASNSTGSRPVPICFAPGSIVRAVRPSDVAFASLMQVGIDQCQHEPTYEIDHEQRAYHIVRSR